MKRLLDWIETWLGNLWLRLEESTENNSLSTLRILYGLYILTFSIPSFAWIGNVPQSFFYPPMFSLAKLFDGFPSYSLLLTVDILLIFCSVAILLGVKARYAGVLFTFLFIFGSSFRFSFGKIDHSIMLPLFVLGLSFTNWGKKYALIPDSEVSKKSEKRILAILSVLLCFGMFTAGFAKALNWIDFDLTSGGFLNWFYLGFFMFGRDDLLATYVLHFPPRIFETFDYVAVLIELSPFIALVAGRKWWQLWLLIISIFHLGNTLLLNIPYTVNAPIYLTFIPLSLPLLHNIIIRIIITTLIAAHQFIYLFTNNLMVDVLHFNRTTLYLGLSIWVVTAWLIGKSVSKSFNPEV